MTAEAFLRSLVGEGQMGVLLAVSGPDQVRPVAWTGFQLDPCTLWFTFDPGLVAKVIEKGQATRDRASFWSPLGGHESLCAPIRRGSSLWGVVYLRDNRDHVQWPDLPEFTPDLPLPEGPDLRLDRLFLESTDDPRQQPAQAFLDLLCEETGKLGYGRHVLLACDAAGGNLRKLAARGFIEGPLNPLASLEEKKNWVHQVLLFPKIHPRLILECLANRQHFSGVHPDKFLADAFHFFQPGQILSQPLIHDGELFGLLYCDRLAARESADFLHIPIDRVCELVENQLIPLMLQRPTYAFAQADLTAPDPNLRVRAIRNFVGAPLSLLESALADEVTAVRLEAIACLARLGQIQWLIQLLIHPCRETALAAAKALASRGGGALPLLLEHLPDSPAEVLRVLSLMGRQTAQAAESVGQVVGPDRPEDHCLLALQVLGSWGLPATGLERGLEDRRLSVRLAAARAAGQVVPVPVAALAKLLDQEETVNQAAESLGAAGSAARPCIPALVRELGVRRPGRETIRQALGRVVDPAAAEADYWAVPAEQSGQGMQLIYRLPGCGRSSHSLAVTPNGRYLLLIGRGHSLQLWNLEAGHLMTVLDTAETREPESVVAWGDEWAVSSHSDVPGNRYLLRIWKLPEGICEQQLSGQGFPGEVSVSAGKAVVAARRRGGADTPTDLDLWDLASGQLENSFVHPQWARRVRLVQQGRQALWFDHRSDLIRVDLSDGQTQTIYSAATAVSASPDGQTLITAQADLCLCDGPRQHRFRLNSIVHHLALSPDQRYLAGLGQELQVWDLEQGCLRARSSGLTGMNSEWSQGGLAWVKGGLLAACGAHTTRWELT